MYLFMSSKMGMLKFWLFYIDNDIETRWKRERCPSELPGLSCIYSHPVNDILHSWDSLPQLSLIKIELFWDVYQSWSEFHNTETAQQ